MKKNEQRTRTHSSAKYGGLSLYDIDFEKRYSIENEYINFVKGGEYDFIGNPGHPNGISNYHEYFFIHGDLFNIIIENEQNLDIALKVIHKYVSFPSINENSTYSRSK